MLTSFTIGLVVCHNSYQRSMDDEILSHVLPTLITLHVSNKQPFHVHFVLFLMLYPSHRYVARYCHYMEYGISLWSVFINLITGSFGPTIVDLSVLILVSFLFWNYAYLKRVFPSSPSMYTGCFKKSRPIEVAAIQISRNLLN